MERFDKLQIFLFTQHKQPNHVLINEYNPGEGIMPHEDGDAYARIVATVSLGGYGCLDITAKGIRSEEGNETKEAEDHEKEGQTSETQAETLEEAGNLQREEPSGQVQDDTQYKLPTRILYEPRSLLITTGSAYSTLMHGISEIHADENLNADTVANWGLLGKKEKIEAKGGRMERQTRISLTYRDVLKVRGSFLFGRR